MQLQIISDIVGTHTSTYSAIRRLSCAFVMPRAIIWTRYLNRGSPSMFWA